MSGIRKAGWTPHHLGWTGSAVVAAAALGVVVGLALASTPASAQAIKTLDAPAGMIFNYIDPDSTEDFEQVMSRLQAVLVDSENPERVEQAAGWKVYRALEPGPNDDVLYVWFLEPTVPGADYSVAQIFNEEVPNEVQSLYDSFNESFGTGQSKINLELVMDFGEES